MIVALVVSVVLSVLYAVALGVLKHQCDVVVRLLDDERRRTRELLTMIQVQRDPQAHWALQPVPDIDPHGFLFDETGLISYRDDD